MRHAKIGAVTPDQAQPTSREALAAHLHELGVREGTYHLFGVHLDDAMVMDRRPEGWVVFYSERGGESSLTAHGDEASACADLQERVTGEEHSFFELVAGPAPADEADAAFDAWLRERGTRREAIAPSAWKFDDVPWVSGPYWRRYFMRITESRRLHRTS